jgi:hypothetical protein
MMQRQILEGGNWQMRGRGERDKRGELIISSEAGEGKHFGESLA